MKKKNNKPNEFLIITAGVALGFILVFGIIAISFISEMNLFPGKEKEIPDETVQFQVISSEASTEEITSEETTVQEEETEVNPIEELNGFYDLGSVLKEWFFNSDDSSLMKSKDVFNILLIGVDASESNADSIIIASINKTQKKIFLTSVFRDSYTYINTENGGTYAKINASYAYGGADNLVKTVENDFKIKIDNYVSVNFESFKSIVDIFGGITLDVQEYEAREIKKNIGRDCPFGEDVILDGEQALMFCRIRKCDVDADISRTRRQRQFINAMIDELKGISISELSSLIKTLKTHVKTDLGLGDLLSVGTSAVSEKWFDFAIESNAVPSDEHRLDYSGNSWVWIVDYPAAAKDLHEKIYGKSNIELDPDRISAVDIMIYSGNTGNASP